MSSRNQNRNDKLAPSIRARRLEIKSTGFVRSLENLTSEEIAEAKKLDSEASRMRQHQLEKRSRLYPNWLERRSLWTVYAWAMHPEYDVFVDLLLRDETDGAVDRARLPGVSVEAVQERIELVDTALADRLQQIEER
ncbi:hypothetical protein [Methylobacterium sp. WL9]|uniref:hypothetical protein n=1 Tax=Methylobacterium sp. WL9 TaxID=2603898 RepID=UPI0011C9610B|nr:hypothetical protein [Methylobacterium sp. WL9]TXN25137.1 hypothetical protein FV217_00985 [Methylobacterium sp. WL9]